MDRDTIVVGGGPAGLAVGACLKRRGLEATILERSERIGDSWARHYPTLRMHTTRGRSALPFYPFPDRGPRYPSRDDVIEYLREYADHFGLDVAVRREVVEVRRAGDRWEVVLDGGDTMRANNVVLATGAHRTPCAPSLPGRESFEGEIVHSARYAGGMRYEDERVLVVGLGNSGADIAVDLCAAGARPVLSVSRPVFWIPIETFGLPWHDIYRALPYAATALGGRWGSRASATVWCWLQRRHCGDLKAHGVPLVTPPELVEYWAELRPPLTNDELVELIREGRVEVRGATVGFDSAGAHFEGGSRTDVSAVVLSTGFTSDPTSLLAERDESWSSGPLPPEGPVPDAPGLYFCGFRPEFSRIAVTARQVADRVAECRSG